MTQRERRYHQRKKCPRLHRQIMAALQRYIDRTKSRPKYPLGGGEGLAMIGEPGPELIDPPAYKIGIDFAAPSLRPDPAFIQVWAVDHDNNIMPVSISQMLQTLEYWAQNKNL